MFGTGPTRSCAARGGRKFGLRREMTVLFFPDAVRGGTFGAGVPESAEFCDGPGPGMALERNSFPADAPTGRRDVGGSKD